ncbi:MAG: hypothetical protein MUE50_12200, partial [Pirellulaceae bacterium]|nr:hypothetical protein [Pirellulaceae bacterium]
ATASTEDMHGDDHDCCRPLPAPVVSESAAGNATSAAAPTESSPAPLRVLSARERELTGDGESPGYGPLFLSAVSAVNKLGAPRLAAASEPVRSPVRLGWLASVPITPIEAIARPKRLGPNPKASVFGPLTARDALALSGRNQESNEFAAAVDRLLAEDPFALIP